MKVTARITKDIEGVSKEPITVEYNFGETLDELNKNFGADVIANRAKASLVIDLQAFMRRQIEAKKSVKEIQKAVAEWKPGLKAPGKSPAEKLAALLSGKTDAEKRALLKEAGLI